MSGADNKIVWVDIPVGNLARAKKFYEFIFGIKLDVITYENSSFVAFPHSECAVSGCLIEEENFIPNVGILIYLGINKRLDDVISKIELHGGSLLSPKEKIGPWGYRAIILDSEKNRIALYSTE